MLNKIIFAQRLKYLRKQNEVSMSALAKSIDIKSKGTISQFENQTTSPSLDTAIRIADFFDVSLDYLVGRSDDPLR